MFKIIFIFAFFVMMTNAGFYQKRLPEIEDEIEKRNIAKQILSNLFLPTGNGW